MNKERQDTEVTVKRLGACGVPRVLEDVASAASGLSGIYNRRAVVSRNLLSTAQWRRRDRVRK